MDIQLLKELNNQVNKELQSEYIYLGMALYFKNQSLEGFANFFTKQAEEEREHAEKIMDYIGFVGEKVELYAITKVETTFEGILEIFEKALEHEKYISNSIRDLYELAKEKKEYATSIFLEWFITEQVEEENVFNGLIDKLNMIENHKNGIIMFDKELAQRK